MCKRLSTVLNSTWFKTCTLGHRGNLPVAWQKLSTQILEHWSTDKEHSPQISLSWKSKLQNSVWNTIPLVSKKRFLKIAFAWECIKYLWKNSKLLVLLFVSGEENGPSREQTAEVLFLFFACGCIYYPEERKSKNKHMIWSGSLFKIYIITLAECT